MSLILLSSKRILLVGLAISLVFMILKSFLLLDMSGLYLTDVLGSAIINGIIYYVIGLVIYLISIAVFKSFKILIFFSAVALGALVAFSIYSANKIDLTQRIGGILLFESGDITPIGVIYNLANPVTLLCVYAVYVFSKQPHSR